MMESNSRDISVLVAEDSPTQRELLLSIIEEAGGFLIVGTARDGLEAISQTERLRPDIVLMDCHMPKASGFEATRAIMQRCPTPIVMISSAAVQEEVENAFHAVRNGALAFLVKPTMGDKPEEVEKRHSLVRTLRLMSEVKVVGRRKLAAEHMSSPGQTASLSQPIKVIAIAGSTGAPGVIAEILSGTRGQQRPPVLVVQHMARGFVEGYARWLSGYVGSPVNVGQRGVMPIAGEVYLAPDDWHMGLDTSGYIALTDAPLDEGFRPSANFLFRSIAASIGRPALGILLTGMGRDGAAGLLAMKKFGATTIAQNEASCVVFGMPREAISLGAVDHVLSPAGIVNLLATMAVKRKGKPGVQHRQ